MCSIILNGEAYNLEEKEKPTLSELLDLIRTNDLTDQQFISDVTCDGVSINLKEEEDLGPKELTEFSSIAVSINSPDEIIFESLQNNDEVSTSLCEILTQVAEQFRVGMITEVMEGFISSLEHIESFLQIINHIRSFMLENYEESPHEQMNDYIKQFLDISAEMLEAQNEDDYILLADLIEYEVVPLLEDWQDISANLKENLRAA